MRSPSDRPLEIFIDQVTQLNGEKLQSNPVDEAQERESARILEPADREPGWGPLPEENE